MERKRVIDIQKVITEGYSGLQGQRTLQFNPNSLSIVTEQQKSIKFQQLPLLSRELGLILRESGFDKSNMNFRGRPGIVTVNRPA